MSHCCHVWDFPWAIACWSQLRLWLDWAVVLGVESRIGADHMRTAVCLPSRTGTCIVGRTDRGVIIETGDKLWVLGGFRSSVLSLQGQAGVPRCAIVWGVGCSALSLHLLTDLSLCTRWAMITGYVASSSILGESLFWAVLMTRLSVSGTSRTSDAWKPSTRTNTLLPLWVRIALRARAAAEHQAGIRPGALVAPCALCVEEINCKLTQISKSNPPPTWVVELGVCWIFPLVLPVLHVDKDVNWQGVLEPVTRACWHLGSALVSVLARQKENKKGVHNSQKKSYFEFLSIAGWCYQILVDVSSPLLWQSQNKPTTPCSVRLALLWCLCCLVFFFFFVFLWQSIAPSAKLCEFGARSLELAPGFPWPNCQV